MNEVVRIMWRNDFDPFIKETVEKFGFYYPIVGYNESVCVLSCFPGCYWPWEYVRHCVKMK